MIGDIGGCKRRATIRKWDNIGWKVGDIGWYSVMKDIGRYRVSDYTDIGCVGMKK